jgi:CDP-paratose 2-epimerase
MVQALSGSQQVPVLRLCCDSVVPFFHRGFLGEGKAKPVRLGADGKSRIRRLNLVGQKLLLVTGSCGLIGSEVSLFFSQEGFRVVGIDNNLRAQFFGPEGDTSWALKRLQEQIPGYRHSGLDVRDREGILAFVKEIRPDLIIHCAAQPSHDRAAAIPFLDFETNALGTLNLLESARQFCPESPFIHMSTNKVYGDRPNQIKLKELGSRWDYDDPVFAEGIPESLSIDQSKHSLFGASKVAADIMVQEYGRYFNLPTCCLRGGCLTGPNHSGVELHGFLSYLMKCNMEGREYAVYGYKGKQVRDNIHAHDVAQFMYEFAKAPRVAEVYNLGGGKQNSCSILEAFEMARHHTSRPMKWRYVEDNRAGDHICYYSDLRKMKSHYPAWALTKSLEKIFEEIVAGWTERLAQKAVG